MNKLMVVSVSLLVLFVAALLLGLPQTSIVVTVAAEPFEKAIPITVDTEVRQPDKEAKVVPGKKIDVTNDDARRVVATGKKDVGTKAKGTVTVSNAWQTTTLTYTAGTGLTSSDGKSFAFVDSVSVPGATVGLKEGQLVTNPGTATATIQATEPGESYNVKAGRFTISGLSAAQQDKIYAESTKDLSGGQTKQVSVMTQADIDTARDALLEDLKKDAIEKLKKEAKNQKLIDESIAHTITNVETNPDKPDSETEYFDIKVKAKHEAMVFDEKEVQQIVDTAIKKEVPEDKELLLGDGDEFVVSVLGKDYETGKLELESKIKTKIGNRIDANAAKQGLGGKSEAAAKEQLAQLPQAKDVAIYPFPRWWWQPISYLSWNTRVRIIYE